MSDEVTPSTSTPEPSQKPAQPQQTPASPQPPSPANPDPKAHPIHAPIPVQPIHEGTGGPPPTE